MKPYFRPLSLTIVDLLGTLVPGAIWLALAVATFELSPWSAGDDLVSPFEMVSTLLRWVPTGDSMRLAWALVFAFACGMLPRVFAMRWTEFLTRELWVRTRNRGKLNKDLVFPYHGKFAGTPLYREVESLIKKYGNLDEADLIGEGAFSFCKRFLKVTSPPLWEESERLEAEVRMMGSLVLASIASFTLSIVSLAKGVSVAECLPWSGFSLVLGLLLAIAFRRRRVREVEYAYLNVVVRAAAGKFERTKEPSGTDRQVPAVCG